MRRLLLAAVGGWALLVMFWNVENLFDPFDDPLTADEQFTPAGEKHWTWKKMQAKLNGVAKTIISVADVYGQLPDIIGLAEVENKLVLRQLTAKTPLSEIDPVSAGCGETSAYGYIHRESPDSRGIDVALLYKKDRITVLAVDSLRINEFQTRDILYVKVLAFPADTLHIFVNHWPSQLGGKKATRDRRRSAQKTLEKALDSIVAANPKSKTIIMGDFNQEEPEIHPGRIICPKKTKMSETPEKAKLVANGTLKFHGKWETIDHFFTDTATARYSASGIFAPPNLLERDNAYLGVKPRRTYVGPKYNGGISDHLPIILSVKQLSTDESPGFTGTE